MKGDDIMGTETREMFELVLKELKNINAKVDKNSDDINVLKRIVIKNSDDIKGLQSGINGLHALIETETNHYVKIIAEGHEMQTEKVNNYINAVENVRAKQELFEIRLSMLERDIKELKRA